MIESDSWDDDATAIDMNGLGDGCGGAFALFFGGQFAEAVWRKPAFAPLLAVGCRWVHNFGKQHGARFRPRHAVLFLPPLGGDNVAHRVNRAFMGQVAKIQQHRMRKGAVNANDFLANIKHLCGRFQIYGATNQARLAPCQEWE